jgi:hypothetical protein
MKEQSCGVGDRQTDVLLLTELLMVTKDRTLSEPTKMYQVMRAKRGRGGMLHTLT